MQNQPPTKKRRKNLTNITTQLRRIRLLWGLLGVWVEGTNNNSWKKKKISRESMGTD